MTDAARAWPTARTSSWRSGSSGGGPFEFLDGHGVEFPPRAISVASLIKEKYCSPVTGVTAQAAPSVNRATPTAPAKASSPAA